MEILPYLHQLVIPTPFSVGPVNIYVARDPDGLTLIDCGPHTSAALEALEAGLAGLGHTTSDIRRILITHAHADHYGLAAELVKQSGAQVLTHPFNRLALQDYGDEREQRLAFYRGLLVQAGVPAAITETINTMRRGIGHYAQAVDPSGELNDGDRLMMEEQEWQVLHTPGHSAGLICLYEPGSRLLLSNDHLLRAISSNPLVEPPPPGQSHRLKSLVEYMAQLGRVAALDISTAWPGHGGPIKDVPVLVQQRIEFHAQRAGRILEIIGQHSLTTFEIAQPLFPRLDPLNFFLAISKVVGHLEWLEAEGRIGSTRHGEIVRWQSVPRF